jgi:hypothetical protein
MFSTLEEQIEDTEGKSPTYAQRIGRYIVVAVLSALLFGGVLLGIWLLEF